MIQSYSTATERKPRGLAKPEAVARVQRGHHGEDSIPRGPAYCNQAGLSSLESGRRLSEAKRVERRLVLTGLSERIDWPVRGLREGPYDAGRG
jgi:hypothetical protein